MALINTSVPNLIQGVSQQPDATRFAGQCEEQENALSSVASGLMKRPNTRHIARLLTSAIGSDSFVHFINRSESEKYVVISYKEYDSSNVHTGCKIRAFNLSSGTEASINSTTGGYALTSSQFEYLHTTSPRNNLKALSIGDTTLLLNTTKAVSPKTAKTAEFDKEALIFITQGDYKKNYTVDVGVTDDSSIVPSGVTAPSITLTAERYLYSSQSHGSDYYNITVRTYRWRIASATLDNGGGGSGITNSSPTFTLTSSASIYTQPDIRLTVSNGSVTNVNLVSGGDLQGVGSNNSTYQSGINQPTISYSIAGVTTGTVATLTATEESGEATTGTTNNPTYANSDLIAGDLNSAMDSATGFNTYFDRSRPNDGNTIFLSLNSTYKDNKDFTISTKDSLANTGMKAVYKEVDAISSLPVENKDGFKVKVKGDPELSSDDYYVQFQTAQGQSFGSGSYVETVGNNIITGYEASTMPHQLINDGVNSFTLQQANYADRVAGDDNSNPLPSFVGSEIEGMFFFKNRLGFLNKENIIMSESGFGGVNDSNQVVFNFGRTSVSTLLDSDPIDVSVTSSRVTNLKSAKGFQENLVLFSENGQFVIKGGDLLTPKTVSITPITNFNFEDQVDPLPLGSYIYFPFTRGNFTGLREFTVNSTTDTYDSVEVTEHVPAYIPKNVIDMAGTTSEDMIALLSGDETGSLYIYNYFWNNNQKVLSAWSKFTFTGEVRGIEFVESVLYAVITNNGETNLVSLPLESGLKDDAGYVTHLDMRVAKTVTHGTSTITLPYTPADNSVEVYTTDGLKLNCTNVGATVNLTQAVNDVDSAGTDIDTSVFVGIPYTMKYTFSEQLFKAKAGQGSSPSNAAKLMVRNGSLYFDNTAFFKVKVTPKFRDTYENIFTPDVVGSTTIGTLNLGNGFYRFPVFTKAQDTTITIENDSALPSNFQSAEFESFVHSRSNRYG